MLTSSTPSRPSRRGPLHALGVLLLGALVVVVVVVGHEAGHLALARLLGDGSAQLTLQTSGCRVCTHYDSSALGPAANAFVNLAGLIVTQCLALLALLVVRSAGRDRRLARSTAFLLALACLADLAYRLVAAATSSVPTTEIVRAGARYVDLAAVASFGAQWLGLSASTVLAIVMALGTAAAVLELWLLSAVWRRPARRSSYGRGLAYAGRR